MRGHCLLEFAEHVSGHILKVITRCAQGLGGSNLTYKGQHAAVSGPMLYCSVLGLHAELSMHRNPHTYALVHVCAHKRRHVPDVYLHSAQRCTAAHLLSAPARSQVLLWDVACCTHRTTLEGCKGAGCSIVSLRAHPWSAGMGFAWACTHFLLRKNRREFAKV